MKSVSLLVLRWIACVQLAAHHTHLFQLSEQAKGHSVLDEAILRDFSEKQRRLPGGRTA